VCHLLLCTLCIIIIHFFPRITLLILTAHGLQCVHSWAIKLQVVSIISLYLFVFVLQYSWVVTVGYCYVDLCVLTSVIAVFDFYFLQGSKNQIRHRRKGHQKTVFLLWLFPWNLSRNISAGVAFVYSKAAVLMDKIKGTLCNAIGTNLSTFTFQYTDKFKERCNILKRFKS
jgi:hypothetical protein